ncbi:uncharacterized protein JCM6883_001849 [Sporobolomyces salmoneus]|uniref:uncharacterized protein n=1 Tax=Sporobolomyces salmoneus TaxID=183962 RepID=UPI00317937B6
MFLFEPILHTLVAPKRPDQGVPLLALITVVVESILEVFFLCFVGFFLARRKIIDAPTKKILNRLNTSLFNPSLLFSKIAFSLTPQTLAELWIVPVGFVIITSFSALVAFGLGRLFRLSPAQRNFSIAAACFQNSNSLPIALVQSLLSEKLPLAWGEHDTKDAMLGRGLSYLVLFSTLGIIVRWSVGVKLVSSAEEGVGLTGDEHERDPEMSRMEEAEQEEEERRRQHEEEDDDAEDDLESSTTLRPESSEEDSNSSNGNGLKPKRSILKDTSSTQRHQRNESASSSSTPAKFVLLNETDSDPSAAASTPTAVSRPGVEEEERNLRREPSLRKKKARIFQSFPNTPAHSVNGGSRASSVYGANGYEEDEEDEDASAFKKFGRGFNRKVWKPVKKFGKGVGDFMTVPLWAALLSLVVACIPPVQHTLDKIEPLKASLRSAGACSVPITLVTLGAYFYTPSAPGTTSMLNNPENVPEVAASSTLHKSFSTQLLDRLRSPFTSSPDPSTSTSSASSVSERRASSGATRTIIVSVLTRMIIVPLVLVPVFGYWAYKTVNRADDPVFVVVACLLIGSPTAITLAQITSASSSAAAFEKLISRTLFVSYAFLTGPTTIALVLAALYIDKLQNPPKE